MLNCGTSGLTDGPPRANDALVREEETLNRVILWSAPMRPPVNQGKIVIG